MTIRKVVLKGAFIIPKELVTNYINSFEAKTGPAKEQKASRCNKSCIKGLVSNCAI